MQLRQTSRKLALALGAVALAGPALTSCGFDYATDRVYTPAAGINERDASVDVLGAVVVSAQPDSGTFVASFANNDQRGPATVVGLAGAGDDQSLQADEFEPIEIPAGGLVNLATEGGIPVDGTFEAGDFLTVTVTFGDGESVEMDIPAVTDCGDFEGLDVTADEPASTIEDQCAAPDAPDAH